MLSLTKSEYWLALLAFLFLPFFTQASCGSITSLEEEIIEIDFEDLFDQDGNFIFEDLETNFIEVTNPIENCDNPFNADSAEEFTPGVTINGLAIGKGDTVTLVEGEPVFIDFTFGDAPGFSNTAQLFSKSSNDYTEILLSFGAETFLDGLPEGEYVAVFTSELLFFNQNSLPIWKQKLKELFTVQTAHAFPGPQIAVFPFAVEYESAKPTGASSVLFLPGIQASRLYTDGVLGTENRLWEPNRDNDVEKLAMTEAGESINDIYTRDVLDEIFTARNIYKSLLDLLDDLKEVDSIKDYQPFAYDWRYDVFTVATEPVKYPNGETKRLLDEIRELASESHTGKVTIVAHSNGGLVAKALMSEYQDTELAGLIDKVIMVATPQLGTPKAIGSLLHGLDQSLVWEFLVSQPTARRTTQFMPGAYGLLPSETYFENFADGIITSDDSTIALPVSSYGDLDNYQNFINFLSDTNGTRNNVPNITQPIKLSANLLSDTVANQTILDSWEAPAEVQVYEVAGTGLETIEGFYYREFSCRETNPHCILIPFVKPVPKITIEGDGTVVLNSATAYEGDKVKYEVDLKEEGERFLETTKNHANITESDSVKGFLESAILYPELSDGLVIEEFGSVSQTYTIIGVHSPVSILVRNSAGEEVGLVGGEIKEEIPGGSYFEFAGGKYAVVPNSEEIEVLLSGEASGRYSLTVEELTPEGEQILVQEVIGATTTASMSASFNCVDGVCGELTADYENDGESDARFGWTGSYEKLGNAEEVPEEFVTEVSSNKASATRVGDRARPTGQVAGATTDISDEEIKRMWNTLLQVQVIINELNIYYNLN